MPYMATAIRATVIDRRNEVLWGQGGCLRRRGSSLFNLGGRRRVPSRHGILQPTRWVAVS